MAVEWPRRVGGRRVGGMEDHPLDRLHPVAGPQVGMSMAMSGKGFRTQARAEAGRTSKSARLGSYDENLDRIAD